MSQIHSVCYQSDQIKAHSDTSVRSQTISPGFLPLYKAFSNLDLTSGMFNVCACARSVTSLPVCRVICGIDDVTQTSQCVVN